MHCGAGPYAAQCSRGNLILGEQVISRAKTVAEEMEITPYATRVFGSNGFAIGDAVALGVESAWLVESVGIATAWKHLPENYDELVNIYFPKCLALFIAMCELTVPVESVPATPSPTPEGSNPIPSQTPNPSPTAPPSPSMTTKPSASLAPQPTESASASSDDEPLYVFSTVAVFSSIVAISLIARKRRAHV
jgi:hypothetical protein